MRVKIHPHRNKVVAGIEECISVTPDTARGHAYYAGTVVLSDVEFRINRGEKNGVPTGKSGLSKARAEDTGNVHAWAVGELIDQNACQHPLSTARLRKMQKVTYHFVIGRFLTIDSERAGMVCYGDDVTDKTIPVLYAVGRDFYIPR